ncbi:MAG: zinc ribbon domain-containing protein [Phycisphaerales bacterium]
MPTYEYRCKSCSHEFEHFQSMKDAPLRKCPECGKNTLERLIGTGAAVIFKGSGFYQTDYRNEAYKKAAEADKPKSESTSSAKSSPDGAAEKKSGDAAKTETKSETKAETKTEKSTSESAAKTKSSAASTSAKSKPAKKSSK